MPKFAKINFMKKLIVLFVMSMMLIGVSPMSAKAITIDELYAQIQKVDTQINNLKTDIYAVSQKISKGINPTVLTAPIKTITEISTIISDIQTRAPLQADPCPSQNRCGHIIVIENTIPDAYQDFSYTHTLPASLNPNGYLNPIPLDDDATLPTPSAMPSTRTGHTVANGNYFITQALVPGYSLVVSCVDPTNNSTIAPAGAIVAINNAETVTCTFTNTKAYTLTYTSDPNGSISGTTPQTVNYGANGTTVTAVPAQCYHFVNWTDGSTQNPRTDTNVTQNITVMANFAINTYTLTYTAGPGGSVVGQSPQTVNCGADGTTVTPVPDAGYHFVGWSDGSTANPRTDTNVTADISVVANFEPYTIIDPNDCTTGWVRKADWDAGYRFSPVGFSIGTKGYIGTGYTTPGGVPAGFKDFWEYTPGGGVMGGIWTQKADFGGTARMNAAGFSIGNKGYIGTGSYTRDFWEYDGDPSSSTYNTWTRKADFGGTARIGAVGFSIGNKGYLGTGGDDDFWEYTPGPGFMGGSWMQKANFPGTTRYIAVGFPIGNKGYIGTGNVSIGPGGVAYQDFWEYTPGSGVMGGSWMQKANFGGGVRWSAAGFSIGNKGYIGTGFVPTGPYGSNGTADLWEYIPGPGVMGGTWTFITNFCNARGYSVGFSIWNKGYIGMGMSNYLVGDLWEISL